MPSFDETAECKAMHFLHNNDDDGVDYSAASLPQHAMHTGKRVLPSHRQHHEDVTRSHMSRQVANNAMHETDHEVFEKLREMRGELIETNPHVATYITYNLGSVYDYTDRLIEPCDCTSYWFNDISELIKHQRRYAGYMCFYFKYLIFLVLGLLYLFSFLWLIFNKMALDYCLYNNVPVAPLGIQLTEGVNVVPVTSCQRLAMQCSVKYLGGMDMSVDAYYTFRLTIFLLSALPLMFISFAANAYIHRYTEGFLNVHDDIHYMHAALPDNEKYDQQQHEAQEVEYATERPNWEQKRSPCHDFCCNVCDSFNFSSRDMYLFASLLVSLTHLVLGILAMAADITIIQYFSTLGAPCTQGQHLDLSQDQDQRCACATVFQANSPLLMRLSSIQLPNAQALAYAMLFPNILYMIWGLLFILRTCRHASNELQIISSTVTPEHSSAQANDDDEARFPRRGGGGNHTTRPFASSTPTASPSQSFLSALPSAPPHRTMSLPSSNRGNRPPPRAPQRNARPSVGIVSMKEFM
jgi:hypothetical protein